MAHYAMLNEYHFSADVDDIRGANLYAANDQKVGKVADVIFDHETGAIRYLVADLGHDRKVLVPSNHVYRSVVDEKDFDTDISAAEMGGLPRFDENLLKDDKKWREHEQEHSRAWKDQEERLVAEYKQKWHESPVQHRQGSDRDITPDEESSGSGTGAAGRREVTAADLFPRSIAGKFPDTEPMVVPGNPNVGDTTLRPVGETGEESRFGAAPPSPRWRSFEETVRHNLQSIRGQCPVCCRPGASRVA